MSEPYVFDNNELRRLLNHIRSAAEGFDALQNEFAKARQSATAADRKATAAERDNESLRRQVKTLERDLVAATTERDSFQRLFNDILDKKHASDARMFETAGEVARLRVQIAEHCDALEKLMAQWARAHDAGELDVLACVMGLSSVALELIADSKSHQAEMAIELVDVKVEPEPTL